jgi:hypothetical protein
MNNESSSGHRCWYAAMVAECALALALAGGCSTPAEHQSARNARIDKEAAQEINRICSLPDAQREAELKRIKDQSGMVLYCGNK